MPKHAVATLVVAFFLAGHLSAQAPDPKTLRVEPAASPSEVITPGGTGYALLVGVGEYPDIEGGSISPLRAPAKDVDALYGFLTDPTKGGFRPENVRRLKDQDATKDAIGIELNDIGRKATADDLVLIYFSGHGFRPDDSDPEGAPAYLIPYLTHPRALTNPAGTCIDYADLAEQVRSMAAQKVVTILDACHAGGVKPAGSKGVQVDVYSRFYEAWEQAQGRPLLLSSDQSEVSWEEEGGSVFTNFLLRGLEGEADADGDAIVGFNEVAAYLEREVPAYTRSKFPTVQTPTRRYAHGPVRGDIPLAVNLGRHQAIQDQAAATRDNRNQAILLARLDPSLEDRSLQVTQKAYAQEALADDEAALLAQLDRFAARTISKDDYVARARAISGTVRPVPVPTNPSVTPAPPMGMVGHPDSVDLRSPDPVTTQPWYTDYAAALMAYAGTGGLKWDDEQERVTTVGVDVMRSVHPRIAVLAQLTWTRNPFSYTDVDVIDAYTMSIGGQLAVARTGRITWGLRAKAGIGTRRRNYGSRMIWSGDQPLGADVGPAIRLTTGLSVRVAVSAVYDVTTEYIHRGLSISIGTVP